MDADAEDQAAALVAVLRAKGLTLATGESCTGGLVGKMITDVSGASEVYSGGWIVYTNEMKTRELGVSSALIAEHGAVSEPVAIAMTKGIIECSGTDLGVAITGIAGPGGGTDEKPVGTVWIAVGRKGQNVTAKRFRFNGDREAVRNQAAKTVLNMLRAIVVGTSNA